MIYKVCAALAYLYIALLNCLNFESNFWECVEEREMASVLPETPEPPMNTLHFPPGSNRTAQAIK